ncbi:uncharacterized protein [Nicotiana tomentosiformis]|uniref:uncharacterized protein n=1 Tax=Nicotiana tomentosiformis TaxID=4098 RepID=UPI00051ACB6E|nr:uncharacterized protein LOC104086872 [Nicotiana tomentosiformis]
MGSNLYGKQGTMWGAQPKQASWIVQKILKAEKYFKALGWTEEEVQRIEKFSIKDIYLKLRGDFQKINWRSMYLAAWGRLLTKERLAKWGCLEDMSCSLCDATIENTNHLFFNCTFSAQVWRALLQWQGIRRLPMSWQQEIEWAITYYREKNATAKVYKMSLAGSIYHIWQERNLRIFQAKSRNAAVLIRAIVQEIHCRGELKQKLARRL